MAGTTLRDVARGYNREAVAGVLGAPVDMATTLANLLIAGGGYAAHKAGLINQPPELIGNDRSVSSSDWIYDRLPHQPALSGSRAETAGRLAGALMSPPAALAAAPTTIRAVARALQEKAPRMIDNYMSGIGAKKDLIVYHGSPHKFDQFDSSKIGTGEGAQAYGYGLYLAESPEVARSYVPKGRPTWRGKEVDSYIMDGSINFADGSTGVVADNEWGAFRKAMESGPRNGEFYKVDLPDSLIARMLDWDKPLGQQAKNIRDFFEPIVAPRRAIEAQVPSAAERLAWGDLADPRVYDPTGKEALFLFGKGRNEWAASPDAAQMFRQRGIPGIRYLDGGSRSAGAGSSNFVVFPGEEGALRILERNGMPLRSQ